MNEPHIAAWGQQLWVTVTARLMCPRHSDNGYPVRSSVLILFLNFHQHIQHGDLELAMRWDFKEGPASILVLSCAWQSENWPPKGWWHHRDVILEHLRWMDLGSEGRPEAEVASSLWELSEMRWTGPGLSAGCRMSTYIIWLFKTKDLL